MITALRNAVSDIDGAIADLADQSDSGLVHYGG